MLDASGFTEARGTYADVRTSKSGLSPGSFYYPLNCCRFLHVHPCSYRIASSGTVSHWDNVYFYRDEEEGLGPIPMSNSGAREQDPSGSLDRWLEMQVPY